MHVFIESEVNFMRHLSGHCLPWIFELEFLTGLELIRSVVVLASKYQGSSVLLPQCWDSKHVLTCPPFLYVLCD